MSVTQTKALTAALLYQTHDPLNFKHLATTLNMILEPAKIKFRVIHERPGQAAVLSCRKLHIAITANEARNASSDLQNILSTEANPSIPQNLQSKIAAHKRTIEVAVGVGPLPHGLDDDTPNDTSLLPLLAQMVVNHLLNMNPADAIYWGASNQIMSPRAFLAMINAPVSEPDVQDPPVPPSSGARSDLMPVRTPRPQPLINPTPNLMQSEMVKEQDDATDLLSQTPGYMSPSFITGHTGEEEEQQPTSELADQIRTHFDKALNGPKAPFVVSAATMLVAPIIGVLLLIYNFSGGARLRQTALFACVAAAVTLAADLSENKAANATAAAPSLPNTTSQL